MSNRIQDCFLRLSLQITMIGKGVDHRTRSSRIIWSRRHPGLDVWPWEVGGTCCRSKGREWKKRTEEEHIDMNTEGGRSTMIQTALIHDINKK